MAVAINDESLAARAAARGPDAASAFTSLVDRYTVRLLRFLVSLQVNAADAEDLAADVWLRAWQKLPLWKHEHFRGWLFTIARNRVKDHFASSRLRRTDPLDAAEAMAARACQPVYADEVSKLKSCLAHLKGDFRTVFLAHTEGQTYESMARTQGVPIGTVQSRLHRARAALQECMGATSA